MHLIETLKNFITQRETSKTRKLPKIEIEADNDAVWILNNIRSPFDEEYFEEVEIQETTKPKEITPKYKQPEKTKIEKKIKRKKAINKIEKTIINKPEEIETLHILEEDKKPKETQEQQPQKTEQIVKDFISEISKGPGKYNINIIDKCILKAEEVEIKKIPCELIRNVIENQINSLERKGATNHWKEEYTDMVRDLSILFLTPYTHSKLLGNNEEQINKLRQKIRELDRTYCD